MKTRKPLMVISWLVVALSAIAASVGALWQVPGLPAPPHYDVTTLRGETVSIWGGSGLYRFDAVAGASQEIAQDIVTLCIGIPLLIFAITLVSKGSLRGKVLHAGTLG